MRALEKGWGPSGDRVAHECVQAGSPGVVSERGTAPQETKDFRGRWRGVIRGLDRGIGEAAGGFPKREGDDAGQHDAGESDDQEGHAPAQNVIHESTGHEADHDAQGHAQREDPHGGGALAFGEKV